MINSSLTTGNFLVDWKRVLVSPLLSSPGLFVDFSNLRKLQYVSKLTERAVFEYKVNTCAHGKVCLISSITVCVP